MCINFFSAKHICAVRRIAFAAYAQEKFFFPSFSCGESPRRNRACPRPFHGKRPALSTSVLVEDGENAWTGELCLNLSTPSQSTLWLHPDGLPSIKALEREDTSTPVARRLTWKDLPFVAHRHSYAITDFSWNLQHNGAHSQSAQSYFFLFGTSLFLFFA